MTRLRALARRARPVQAGRSRRSHHKDAGHWSAYRSGEERGEIPDHAVGGARDDPPPSHGKD